MFIEGLIIGGWIGCFVGVILMCMLQINRSKKKLMIYI
nr:MAG TPA: Protein of unknown function (DUF3789) [Caudoviricetes sp.]